MQEQCRDLFREYKWDGRPFVLAGMGPTFNAELIKEASSTHNIFGINKVVREVPVDICGIIDWYIIDKVRDSIKSQAKYLAVPYWPHFGYRPNFHLTIEECSANLDPIIKSKLLCYNLSTMKMKRTKSPLIFAYYFSAEASLNIIANLGCKEVKAIGIDGGDKRSSQFSDHGPCDPRGFDMQWECMARTINRHGLNYTNLDGSPINEKLQEKLLVKV